MFVCCFLFYSCFCLTTFFTRPPLFQCYRWLACRLSLYVWVVLCLFFMGVVPLWWSTSFHLVFVAWSLRRDFHSRGHSQNVSSGSLPGILVFLCSMVCYVSYNISWAFVRVRCSRRMIFVSFLFLLLTRSYNLHPIVVLSPAECHHTALVMTTLLALVFRHWSPL